MSIVRGTVIWRDPVIAYSAQFASPASLMAGIGDKIAHRRAVFLPLIAWSVENDHSASNLTEMSRRYCSAHPNHTIIHMCNTQAEVELLRSMGEKAEWFNHNAFVDPDTYRIQPNAAKKFDAVYVAQLEPFKRHCLASQIKSVAFVYHSYGPAKEKYRQEIKKAVAGAYFANHDGVHSDGDGLSKSEVEELLSQSRVGLCLSAMEGAMHASIEYLLAGLPVVSTANKGGRDEYFEADFTLTAQATAEAVAQACYELIARECSPERIRNATIAKQRAVLSRFQDFINRLLHDEGVNQDIRPLWQDIYHDKLLGWEPADDFLKRL